MARPAGKATGEAKAIVAIKLNHRGRRNDLPRQRPTGDCDRLDKRFDK
jgi:hypothetical protein